MGKRSNASKAPLPLQDMGQLQAGTSGRTARATTVVRDGQENEGDMRNRHAGPSSAAPEPAQKEPEGPCPNRCAPGEIAHAWHAVSGWMHSVWSSHLP